MRPETPGLYTDARIYDILHGPGTEREIDGLVRIAAGFACPVIPGQTWLEPACGTGRYLVELSRRGHRVIGFDREAGMVAFARERLRRFIRQRVARVFRADLGDFASSIPSASVDVAFIPINTIRHLESDAAMLRHLAHMKRVLRPGGISIIGLSLSWYGYETASEDVWEGKSRGTKVMQVVEFVPPSRRGDRKEHVFSHLAIRRGSGTRRVEEHRDSRYWLRTYSRGQWHALLRKSPLSLVGTVNERGESIDPGPMGYALYVLRRPVTRRRGNG